jgi:hypothetical protein
VTTTPVELKIGPVRTDGVEVNRRVPALDGLRGLAIIAVFLYHYGAGGSTSSVLWVRCFSRILGVGWSGVDLFFVLSEFLITGILFNTQTDPEYYKNFYVRRALRRRDQFTWTEAGSSLAGAYEGALPDTSTVAAVHAAS